jgi:Cu+-exporting ATPase
MEHHGCARCGIKMRLWQAGIAGIFGIFLIVLMHFQIPRLWLITLGILTFAVMSFAGFHIYFDAGKSLLKLRANMNTLVALGIGAAWIYSMIIVIWPKLVPQAGGYVYFEAAVIILAFINLGTALETHIRGKIKLLEQTQNTKTPISKLTDRVIMVFVPLVIILAIGTAIFWIPNARFMMVTAVSVLIIASPRALSLAVPMAVNIGMGKAAERGVLIKYGDVLQGVCKLTTIILDKTGTITKGKPEIIGLHPTKDFSEELLLKYAASVEMHSEHPLAASIIAKAKERNIELLKAENFKAVIGKGVSATIENKSVVLGNAKLLGQHKVAFVKTGRDLSETPIFLAVDKKVVGAITINDPIKEDSKDAISKLKQLGLKVVMLTGDKETAANEIAQQVGIEYIIAEVLPQDKAAHVKILQSQNESVGMVGDGINNASALTQANVGFAIGAGADITLMSSSINSVVDAIIISRATMRNIKQNLFGAFVYNMLAIPIAAGILYPFIGMLLNPMIAGAALALSSLTVVMNANRLRYLR